LEFWFIPHQTEEFYQLYVVDEHTTLLPLSGSPLYSTRPSSAFGEAHVPLLPSALDLQPLQNKPKVLDAWISLPSQNMTIKLRRREANKGVLFLQKKPTI